MDEEFEVGLELEHSSSDKTSSWGKAYPHYVKAMKLGHSIAYLKVGLCHLFGMHATRIDYVICELKFL
jgi:TPR repeat protein